MSHKSRKIQILVFIWLAVISFTGFACNLFSARGEPASSPTPAPQVTYSVSDLEQDGQELSRELTETARFEYSITETELSALVNSELAKQSEPILLDPQIRAQEGQITIVGIEQQSGFSLETEIVLAPRIDASGNPFVEVISLSVGPFEAPQELQDQVSKTVNALIINELTANQPSLKIDTFSAENGVITIEGSKQ